MKSTPITPQQRLLLGGLLGIMAVWVYSLYVLAPLIRQTVTVKQALATTRQQVSLAQLMIANEPNLREQHRRLTESVANLRLLLTTEEEIPSLIKLLSDLASQANVKIQTISPLREEGEHPFQDSPAVAIDPMAMAAAAMTPVAGQIPGQPGVPQPPSLYREVPIQIEAVAGYHQLGVFLELMETAEKPLLLTSLHIAQDEKELKRHPIELTLHTYVAAPEPLAPQPLTSNAAPPS